MRPRALRLGELAGGGKGARAGETPSQTSPPQRSVEQSDPLTPLYACHITVALQPRTSRDACGASAARDACGARTTNGSCRHDAVVMSVTCFHSATFPAIISLNPAPAPVRHGTGARGRFDLSQKWRGNLRFLPQPEMRPSSIKTNSVESREAPPISTVSLISHRHSEKLLEATGKRRGCDILKDIKIT